MGWRGVFAHLSSAIKEMFMHKKILYTTLVLISLIVTVPFVALQGKELIPLNGIDYSDLTPSAKKEVECLADNIYFESGYEPKDGKIAVALVTMNRVKKGFEDSVCGVVRQKTHYTCQFSWWCDAKAQITSLYKSKYFNDRQREVYQQSQDVALFVYMNHDVIKDNTKGALYYHADYVNPQWKLRKTVTIGRHIFYSPY
jgi:spore germination cell wall hydrolase CwlJ-like protein